MKICLTSVKKRDHFFKPYSTRALLVLKKNKHESQICNNQIKEIQMYCGGRRAVGDGAGAEIVDNFAAARYRHILRPITSKCLRVKLESLCAFAFLHFHLIRAMIIVTAPVFQIWIDLDSK